MPEAWNSRSASKGERIVPLVVFVGSFAAFAALGLLGVHVFAPWTAALRFALLAMFLLTGSAHFTKTRLDLVAIVPPGFPSPGLLVTITGICEIAGAAVFFFAATRPLAAIALIRSRRPDIAR